MKLEGRDKEDPLALREVQEWKASVWDEVRDLPFGEAVRSIAERAHQTALELGFNTVVTSAPSRRVAETGAVYVTKGDL